MIRYGSPEEAGLAPIQLDRAYGLLERWVAERKMPAAAVQVTRRGIWTPARFLGRFSPEPGSPPLTEDAIFLVASVTKPLTALAAMMLVERGQIALDQPVRELVPEFKGKGKEAIRVLHLLTHTSGLPDMVPANQELRERHAGLEVFIEHVCDCDLLFQPGTSVSYQSAGIAFLGEIVRRADGTPLPGFLDREVFAPLGMGDTSLGVRDTMKPRLAAVRLPREQRGTDWHWNTDYWLKLGVPWGGLLTTVRDITILLRLFTDGGTYGETRILGRATVQAMITNQVAAMPDIPDSVKARDAWGFGWQLKTRATSSNFGDLVSARAYGHGGATGTVVWADPELDLTCAVFTTEPGSGRRLGRVSTAIAAAAT